MIKGFDIIVYEVLLVGITVVCATVFKYGLEKLRVSPIFGFIMLGFLLKVIDLYMPFLTEEIIRIYEFLAYLGIIVLLFKVGLESNLSGLVKQLKHASIIWTGNMILSGLLGYAAAFYIIGLAFIPSLLIGTALTATSVGISISAWRDAGALNSSQGQLLIDVAEMDDISAVILMALVFSIIPILQRNEYSGLLSELGHTAGVIFIKAILFGMLCIIFSRYLEKHVTAFFSHKESKTNHMLITVGIGFIIASFAGLMGLSVAVGALFAGLIFSRDPEAVKIDASFDSFFELFSPFFFIGIGLMIEPLSLTGAILPGLMFLLIAVLGKLIGNGIPSLALLDARGALLISISMIPRAEIALLVVHQGRKLGDWALPPHAFSAVVFVVLVTSVLTPLVLGKLFYRWSQNGAVT
ncbi:MAG: cation:proton antiporter [Nitrospirota bacterium]